MKILVIQQKMIGDVLVSSILCENLRYAYPNAQIDYLIYDSTKTVVDGATYIDNLILFSEKQRKSKWELFKFILKIRKAKYDLIIDPYSKLESWLLVYFSGATKTISFEKKGRNFIYTDVVKRRDDYSSNLGTIIEQRLALLEPLKINNRKVTFPTIHVSDTEKRLAQSIFEKHHIEASKKTVMVSIIGSDLDKTYPFEYMAQILDFIAENCAVNILFNYIPKQIDHAKALYNLCKSTTQESIYFEVIGGSIREFIAIMDKCDIIVGNDGGAINMAKALHKPSFVVFSPWIDKKGWALIEDGITHISFHLNEFKPELFANKTPKEIKAQNTFLYQQFIPELFLNLLKTFLAKHIG
ncbi:glycosyltransferase family 9 protein [Flavobacterium difficile]|nr:glycosyltransferase family 9 protein [Flavobacterium difficile]